MFKLEEIEKYTNGKIICGDKNKIISNYYLGERVKNINDYFYIPIIFRNFDREEYIIDNVKNGCVGFFINENFENKDKIEEIAKRINNDICIIEEK